jgi:hypothetical protein
MPGVPGASDRRSKSPAHTFYRPRATLRCVRMRGHSETIHSEILQPNHRSARGDAGQLISRRNSPAHRRLCAALALVFGTESLVVFRDMLQMDDREASRVESWAVRVLARAALVESNRSSRGNQAKDGAGRRKKASQEARRPRLRQPLPRRPHVVRVEPTPHPSRSGW